MKMSEFDFYLEDFLLYCQNKNLSPKTLSSYEQSLRLFFAYLTTEHGVERLREVRTGHVRQYIAYIQERGKYTVVNREASKQVNHPENRTDYKKQVSSVTINNYLRNMKVFFNWLHEEGELIKNPFDKVEQLHSVRRQKSGVSQEEFNRLLEQFDYTTFHGYRNKIVVLLLQDTGMRIGECLEIEVDQI